MSELKKTSKNVKEQKKKLFGTNPQPSAGPKREKHMSQIQDFAMRRYGLKISPSGGKIDEKTGKRRSETPEVGVDKPDWRSGQLESQSNPMAQTHELSHLELMPEGVDLPGGQRLMDKQYADIQRNHGYMQQKRSSHEIQPQAIENPIRQRAGLPKVTRDVPAKEGSPARMTVDTNEPAGIRIQRGKKLVDQAASSKLLNEQNRDRLAQVDEGSLKYDPAKGWYKATNTDALINLRGRGKQEEAQARLKSKATPAQAPAFDFNSLSADDQAAVQEFLNQRKNKLAASEELKKAPVVFDAGEDENKYTEVWRMQNEKGEGPYRSKSRWQYGEPHSDKTGRPGPTYDKGFTAQDLEEGEFGPQHSEFGKYPFAFENIDHLNQWFTPNEQERLSRLGYKPTKIKAKKVWSSGKQAFYEPYKGTQGIRPPIQNEKQEFLNQRKNKLAASEMEKHFDGAPKEKFSTLMSPTKEELAEAKAKVFGGLLRGYKKTFGLDDNNHGQKTGEHMKGKTRRSGPRGIAWDANPEEVEKFLGSQIGINRPAFRDSDRPGDSEAGVIIRRDNPGIQSYTKGPVMGRIRGVLDSDDFLDASYSSGAKAIKRAKEKHKNVLSELRSMPKPNLPKSEDVSDPMGIGSMLKAEKPVNPKDPVLGKEQPKTVSDDYQIRMQKFLASKMKKTDDANDPMIEDNLSTIRRKSNIIDDYVDSDDELPEWAKDKVTQAKTHMTDVMDYVGSDDMEKDEKPFKGYNKNKHARTGGLNDKEPENYYSKLEDGTVFTHNFDFDKAHD